jgi:hypothetical protein
MDHYEKQGKRREAMHRLRDQRRRAGELRGRVVAISLVSFALLWGVVFAQMATGNDPVLGDGSKTANSTAQHHARKHSKTRAARTEAGSPAEPGATETEPVLAATEAEVAEFEAAEAEAAGLQASEVETLEAEAEAAEAEVAEAELFVEEPAPVTTSQS